MSQQNVELVQGAFAAWEAGEIDRIVEGVAPDIEIVQPPEVPDSKTYRGKEGMVEAFTDWPKQWDELRAEMLEVLDISETKVVAVTRHYLRARDMEIEQEVSYAYTFRDGLLARWEMFLTRDEALAAAARD